MRKLSDENSKELHIHIYAPEPTEIKPVPINWCFSGIGHRFVLVKTNCCGKARLDINCEVLWYEWHDPYVRCKKDKGCRLNETKKELRIKKEQEEYGSKRKNEQ